MIDQSHHQNAGSKEKNVLQQIRTDQSPSLFKEDVQNLDKGYTPQFQLTSNFAKGVDDKPNLLDELQSAIKLYSEDNEMVGKDSVV